MWQANRGVLTLGSVKLRPATWLSCLSRPGNGFVCSDSLTHDMNVEGPRRLSRALKEEPRPFAVGQGSTPGDEGEGLGGFTRRQHFNASFVRSKARG
jgi:hypothetical protein